MARKKKDARSAADRTEQQARPETEQEISVRLPAAPSIPAAEPADFPIVGIGASAGGLAAFEAFLSGIPANTTTGIAFVFVQHLAPDHASVLGDLIQHYTSMNVHEVEDGMRLEPDNVYLIPPNHDMALLHGALHLLPPTTTRGLRLPIDFFFRSLAQDQRGRAIGVLLSGTGTDGTLGARAIKGEGGMIMAQYPQSAEYEGMPASVIAAGSADYILPPADMPAQLLAYTGQLIGSGLQHQGGRTLTQTHVLNQICVVVRARTGHDFAQYKENTVMRRVERRMALQQIASMEEYLRFLQNSSEEAGALFRDLLIGVTSFFRDPEAFAVLKEKALPLLFASKAPEDTLRVWVGGCSTGEEAYSIAILLREYMEANALQQRVQIFATDIDGNAIVQARTGLFPANIAADISAERLTRHFVREPGSTSYRIKKSIRDMVIFSEQNLIKDPPFSKVDLICCRNVLIYMNAALQRKLIPLFHYALNPAGILFLGTSESASEHTTLFTVLENKWKIYLRRQNPMNVSNLKLSDLASTTIYPLGSEEMTKPQKQQQTPLDFGKLVEGALLSHFAPVGILVDRRGEIRFIHGRTGKYLEPAPGNASNNILNMAREGLRRELMTALHKAATYNEAVNLSGLRITTNDATMAAQLTVKPIPFAAQPDDPNLFLVILEEGHENLPATTNETDQAGKHPGEDISARIAYLEHELTAQEEYLRSTLEEMETTNEELRAANEELQSINEELQSTNEELETSQEELQSVNEELSTVNAELQAKMAELSHTNDDMVNLLAGTGIGTLFVDHQLCITRFTPAITQVLNLIQGDIGRPVAHIVSNFIGYGSLVDDIQAVLDDLQPREATLKTNMGAWYLMRIRPYRTLNNVIEGAVVTFVDITERRQIESTVQVQLAEITSYYDNAPIGLAVLDSDLHFVRINKRMAAINGFPPSVHIGQSIAVITPDLAQRAQQIAAEVRATGKPVVDQRISGETEGEPGIRRTWQTGWYPLKDGEGTLTGFSVIMYELTDEREGADR